MSKFTRRIERKKNVQHLTIDQLIRETYAAHYLLRNLEFPAEDIYVGVPMVANAEIPGRNATVQLKHDNKTFTIILGPIFSDQEENEYLNKWTEFAYSQPHQSKKALDEIIANSVIWQNKVSVLAGLIRKGFKLPGAATDADIANVKFEMN